MNKVILGTDYTIREATEGDKSFICATWLKSYLNGKGSPFNKHFLGWKYQGMLIEKLLKQSKVVVAGVGNDIYGYAISEKKAGQYILHWCYVRNDFRGFGICGELMKAGGRVEGKVVALTHLGNDMTYEAKDGGKYLRKSLVDSGYVFIPSLAFEDDE